MKAMTIYGVGPKWGVTVVAYAALITFLGRRHSILMIPDELSVYTKSAAALLLAIGIPFYVLAGRAMFRAFKAGRLVTDGPYRACRHPIYGSWIVFILPAIELLFGTWLGLSSSLFAYALLRLMAQPEERYLFEKFGGQYVAYRKRTPFVLPVGWFMKSPA